MSVIEVKHLIKEYQRKKYKPGVLGAFQGLINPEYTKLRAVDDISFSIEEGESVGYVGPNGSGKSTTIKMLSGILTPTEGSVLVNGMVPQKERIKNNKQIGVVFGNRSQLWWDVPIIESFKMLQKLYEIPKGVFEANLEEFTQIMDLEPFLHAPERQLSLGQKMRCNITAAFLHNPKVVYLDEPTIGLDAESKLRIREFIRKVNREKKTTFIITSHDFQDIEALCKRIILINHGKVMLDSEITKVKKEFEQFKNIHILTSQKRAIDVSALVMQGVTFAQSGQFAIEAECDVAKADAMRVIEYISRFYEVEDISISGRDIESIIRDLLKKDAAGSGL